MGGSRTSEFVRFILNTRKSFPCLSRIYGPFFGFKSWATFSIFVSREDILIHQEDAVKMGNDMIDAEDVSENNAKKPPPVCEENEMKNTGYPSPSPEDATKEKPLSTTPPPLRKSGENVELLSAETLSTEINSALSIPELLCFRTEFNQQSHLISTIHEDAPVNPNEAEEMMSPQIPQINLQMRHGTLTQHRVTEDQNRPAAQTMETQHDPIQHDSREEEGGPFDTVDI